MRTFLSEYGMTILTSFIGLILILLMSPVGTSLGTSLTDIVITNGENGGRVVAAITPSEDDESNNEYDNIDTWYGIENTRITYAKTSGSYDITVEQVNDKVYFSCNEGLKSASLDEEGLEIDGGVITLADDFIKDENYHQIVFVTEDDTQLIYIFRI